MEKEEVVINANSPEAKSTKGNTTIKNIFKLFFPFIVSAVGIFMAYIGKNIGNFAGILLILFGVATIIAASLLSIITIGLGKKKQ